jgi:hypothetical protein
MYVTEREHSLIKRMFILCILHRLVQMQFGNFHALSLHVHLRYYVQERCVCMYVSEREHSLIKRMFILCILHCLVQMQFGNFHAIPHNFQNRGNYTLPILCSIPFITLTNFREKLSTMVFKTCHVQYQDYATTEEQNKSKEVSS